jgi:hypothetical protein
MAFAAIAVPASAQQQEGLVNVNISDNVVQVPIGIAANVCDVNAAVLARIEDFGTQECNADADAEAEGTVTPPAEGEPVQEGLVNVNVSGNTVQVPVAAALNLCDVNIAVIAEIVDVPGEDCDAQAGASANRRGNS